jgi:hypothetical protein
MPTIRYNVDRKRGLDNFSQAGFSVRIVVAENPVFRQNRLPKAEMSVLPTTRP